jgi:alkanesulfonate monooxygenase SsuD/methylene tetrahydromethanopterin reductase-like flavin-dependent oxidoreductase (luciferase family)
VGNSDRAFEIAVRHADGGHAPGMEPGEFAALARRLDRAGRPPLTKSVQLRTTDLRDPREQVERFADAGATTAVFVLDTERGPGSVRRLAEEVL